MNVPLRVRRCLETEPAAAALFAGCDAASLLALCVRLGLDPDGRVYPVADGLLLRLTDPTGHPLPGALRLRAIAPDLLLPVDAQLVPALLDDEARGMTRDRGLIFLPGDRVLAFDHRQSLPLSMLLSARSRPRREWGPLPDRPAQVERIESIRVEFPDESPEAALDAGSGGTIGIDARPADESGPGTRNPGESSFSRIWNLAKSFLRGRSGEGRAETTKDGARRREPDAGVIGRQDAALRDLMREFREGDIEKALRRAIPMADPADSRGSGVHGGDNLPDRDLRYRLDDLLGGASDPPGDRWLGGGDLIAALSREYRKAAEEASRRGDHRRAAAIYGKLLRDHREAALALLRGGLYHDAGVILLARLDDRRGAALAFAAAGEADRALDLYREVGDHEAAGDLLRGLGEEELAVAEYLVAANRMTSSGGGHLAAGNLLLEKAGRPDLAQRHYEQGWGRRPAANAVACAVKIASLLASRADVPSLRLLVDEADVHFSTSHGTAEPGRFYNEVATLGDRPGLEQARDELRDRALMGLAACLRGRVLAGEKAATLVSSLLGATPSWPAAVVSDAFHAVGASPRPAAAALPTRPHTRSRFRVCTGTVGAVAGASESGEVFLGTSSGEVWAFRPQTSEAVFVASNDLPVSALATDPAGEHLVVLRSHTVGRGTIGSYARQPDGRYAILTGKPIGDVFAPWLTPIARAAAESLVGIWDGAALHLLSVGSLASLRSLALPDGESQPPAALFHETSGCDPWNFTILAFHGRQLCQLDPQGDNLRTIGLNWRPEPQGKFLQTTPLSWFPLADGGLELAGLDEAGTLHCSRLRDGRVIARNSSQGVDERGYLAAAIVREGLVAAVSSSRIDWMRCGASKFVPWRTAPETIPSAVAAFASRPTGELLVVCHDGYLVRVPIPT
ncbi:tetratricopeptide repeat protein [Isosphaeraceae bacterium EP7]